MAQHICAYLNLFLLYTELRAEACMVLPYTCPLGLTQCSHLLSYPLCGLQLMCEAPPLRRTLLLLVHPSTKYPCIFLITPALEFIFILFHLYPSSLEMEKLLIEVSHLSPFHLPVCHPSC